MKLQEPQQMRPSYFKVLSNNLFSNSSVEVLLKYYCILLSSFGQPLGNGEASCLDIE